MKLSQNTEENRQWNDSCYFSLGKQHSSKKMKKRSAKGGSSIASSASGNDHQQRQLQRDQLMNSRKSMRSGSPPNTNGNSSNSPQLNITSMDTLLNLQSAMLRSYAADASGMQQQQQTDSASETATANGPQHISEAINQLTFSANNILGSTTGVSMNTNVVPLSEINHNAPMEHAEVENNGDNQSIDANNVTNYHNNPLMSSSYASSTECLHLTLMLRRTLSELDQRTKHLNEANVEKLSMYRQVEQCKLRLEKLQMESEELQRRTEKAEAKAQAVIDDEARQINEAENRAAAAEKRFEILVDWSRKEESRRMAAEESCRTGARS